MNDDLTISVEENGFKIVARLMSMGDDLVVLLSGGEAHIGAVALSQRDADTSTVIAAPGHREDTPAKIMAEALSTALGRTVVVIAGMHWDDLSKEGIATVLKLCQQLTREIIAEIKVEWER